MLVLSLALCCYALFLGVCCLLLFLWFAFVVFLWHDARCSTFVVVSCRLLMFVVWCSFVVHCSLCVVRCGLLVVMSCLWFVVSCCYGVVLVVRCS